MKIGAMNNPSNNLSKEIKFISENFDFLDLTLEYDQTYPGKINIDQVQKLIKKFNLTIIGHTPWNLPIASPYSSVRIAATKEYYECLDVFKKLGVKLVNAHPVLPSDVGDPSQIIEYNLDFFKKIVAYAKKYNIKIMMENTKSIFNDVDIIGQILNTVKGLYLHWDVGHANLGNEGEQNTELAFLKFRKKIKHIHLSDNNGQEDQHLPLGTGNINWEFIIKILNKYKYNKTITLEIHSLDISYLLFSRDRLKMMLEAKE